MAHIMLDFGIDLSHYASPMSFIATKASLNPYATGAIIRCEAAVSERVISSQYEEWMAADPECVALHLGAYTTYAVRQGGS